MVVRSFLLLSVSLLGGGPATGQVRALPDRTAAAATAAGRAADLAYFRSQFLARDVSFSATAREEAERRLARLNENLARVSQAAFDLELARIVALADNGHSQFLLSPMARFYNRVGVRFAVFGDNLYVVRATELNGDLLGSRLVAIDGHPFDELRAAGRRLRGGVAAFRDRMVVSFFESPELLHADGLASEGSHALYSFELPDGSVIERRLEGDAPSPQRPNSGPINVLFPEPLDLERGSWRTALPAERAPWALQERDRIFRSRLAPELHAVVLQLRSNSSFRGEDIRLALQRFEQLLRSERPANVIVDMRHNPGGDLNNTRDFMRSLPNLVSGRIFVLTSPFTFSAAIASIGYLRQSSPERVTIVGEEVGDRLVFFAEGSGGALPNSATGFGYATERHDYANGCRTFTDCHRAVARNPIAVASLAPDIPAPWTITSYLTGRDPAIEAIAAALREGR